MCIDGTHSEKLGKYINDSKVPNSIMRVKMVNETPHLCLYAIRDIASGIELRYDYGDPLASWWRKDLISTRKPFNIRNLLRPCEKTIALQTDNALMENDNSIQASGEHFKRIML